MPSQLRACSHCEKLFVLVPALFAFRRVLSMAAQRVSGGLLRSLRRASPSSICGRCLKLQRAAASQAGGASPDPTKDLVESSSLSVPPLPDNAQIFDPLKSSRGRKRQLPPSRFGRPSRFLEPIAV